MAFRFGRDDSSLMSARKENHFDPETAWRAVANRNGQYDGAFVYAVASTGIYCRPSCPSRRPRRENVTLFATTEEAERGGYRACHRCKPKSVPTVDVCVDAARIFIDGHLEDRVTLSVLATRVGLSASHLQRVFTARVGLSPMAYAKARRLERFKRMSTSESVSSALYDAGFGSSRALDENANASFGMSPGRYKRGGKGVEIRYATAASRLGRVLVAVTDRGICAVLLGDDVAAVEAELKREFFAADIKRDASIREEVARVALCVEGRASTFAIDLRGTDLQLRVWTALQAIPRGETRSYAELAQAVGKPAAVRAVASACAANRLAVVVPCHRAVRKTGEPSGYRWGLSRKVQLLDEERERLK